VKRVTGVTIALGLMGLSLAGCGSFLPKPKPSSSRIFVLFSPLQVAERQDSDLAGQIRSALVRSDYLDTLIDER